MKNFITLFFCLAISTLFAQDNGINLINSSSNDTTFLKENRRIKVKTTDGKSIAGKFSIVKNTEISIKNKVLVLDSIVSIRKASIFSAIMSPVSVGVGAVFLVGSIGLIAAGGIGVVVAAVLVPVGLPLFIVPFTANKHPIKKWKYEIVND